MVAPSGARRMPLWFSAFVIAFLFYGGSWVQYTVAFVVVHRKCRAPCGAVWIEIQMPGMHGRQSRRASLRVHGWKKVGIFSCVGGSLLAGAWMERKRAAFFHAPDRLLRAHGWREIDSIFSCAGGSPLAGAWMERNKQYLLMRRGIASCGRVDGKEKGGIFSCAGGLRLAGAWMEKGRHLLMRRGIAPPCGARSLKENLKTVKYAAACGRTLMKCAA